MKHRGSFRPNDGRPCETQRTNVGYVVLTQTACRQRGRLRLLWWEHRRIYHWATWVMPSPPLWAVDRKNVAN